MTEPDRPKTFIKRKRAQIILAADAGASDAKTAARVVVGGSAVYRTKRRFVEGNLELAQGEDRLAIWEISA